MEIFIGMAACEAWLLWDGRLVKRDGKLEDGLSPKGLVKLLLLSAASAAPDWTNTPCKILLCT